MTDIAVVEVESALTLTLSGAVEVVAVVEDLDPVDVVFVTEKGDTGATGADSTVPGPAGPQGPPGSGGGGGGAVDSVNGHVGVVVLSKADLALGNVDNTADTAKPVSTAQQSALDLKADLVTGKVPASQLPSYVDDVLEFVNLAGFPATGESGKIYVDLATGKIYRWSGMIYVEISASMAQVNADWNAVGTVAEILNKPASGSGTAFLDFGSAPGSNVATVAVTGQAGILTTHVPSLTFDYGAIDSYSSEEVQFVASLVRLQYSDPVAGVGFTIYGFSLETITGRLSVGWRY